MNSFNRRLTLLLLFLVLSPLRPSAAQEPEQPKAFLRVETLGGTPHYYVEVETFRPIKDGADVRRDVLAALYNTATQRQIANSVMPSPASNTAFRIDVPLDESEVIKQHGNFQVVIHSYPLNREVLSSIAAVGMDVSIGVEKDARCSQPFRLSVVLTNDSGTDYGRARMQNLIDLLRQPGSERLVKVLIEPRDADEVQTLNVNSLSLAGSPQLFTVCLAPNGNIPSSSFDMEFRFDAAAPIELRQEQLLLTDVDGRNMEASITGIVENEDPGDRPLERNLDLSVLLGSSVETVEKADGTKTRERTTRGTLDVRLAPWLNLPVFKLSQTPRTRKYVTPFFLDAKVSTGKIEEETLSLNRVVLGAEGEIRHYSSVGIYPDLQRYIFRFSHASDRDFKQNEYKVSFEFQPLFGRLNHYREDEPDVKPNRLDPDPRRGKKIFGEKFFGYQVRPVLGFELGRTYARRNPAAALSPSPTVRRFYFGGEAAVNLSSHFTLSVTDLAYVRGEAADDRLHNYFVGTIEAPLANINDRAAHGFFFSFERGGQPPFANPDVNVLKFGYRIRSNGWFGQFR